MSKTGNMKKKKTTETGLTQLQDKTAGWLAKGIIKVRSEWADAMARLMARLSPRWQKTVWLSCAFLMTFYCSCLIAFSFNKDSSTVFHIGMIRKPMTEISNDSNHPKIPKPAQELIPIVRFRKYLDSLSSTAKGRQTKDSLLKMRPGLMDSLETVERLYQQ
jgi:hypothetical protein